MVMSYLLCQKRRRIVIRKQNGNNEEIHRCAHGVCAQYKNNINETICKKCILRQPIPSQNKICKEHPPFNPIWQCPYYDDDNKIIYPFVENVQPPPIPKGYTRKSNNLQTQDGWTFISLWNICLYRNFTNRLTPRGDIQIKAYCKVLKKEVEPQNCIQCQTELIKLGGSLDEERIKNDVPLLEPADIPSFPGAITLLDNYLLAVKRWIAAGRPTRTDENVKKIHEEFCSRCDWYDPESKRCKGCGCKVKPKGVALLNKIKMATEHCQRNYW
jgi:hypothetical protein